MRNTDLNESSEEVPTLISNLHHVVLKVDTKSGLSQFHLAYFYSNLTLCLVLSSLVYVLLSWIVRKSEKKQQFDLPVQWWHYTS